MLIIDRHGSHCTIDVYKYYVKKKIILYCLPSHTTYYLQSLDVGIFKSLADRYRKRVRAAGRYSHMKIDETQFLKYLQDSRDNILIFKVFKTAFAVAGLFPWDLARVIEKFDTKYTNRLRSYLALIIPSIPISSLPSPPLRKKRWRN